MTKPIVIGRPIGPAHAPFIVAELSANHLGSLARAHAIVDAAADADDSVPISVPIDQEPRGE